MGYSVVKPNKKVPSDKVFKIFSGLLRRVNVKDFGVIKTVAEMLEETVSGEALLSFDKVEQAYVWRILQLKRA
ncbi:hypothetical protein [Spirosoma sp.]|uniref:hypothetical protein n=1 Tax=Spirosoma sp. TaxID=1899569 RepID=UPI003B3ABA9B